jgi:biopolymer transport protein ExbD/biopolymer transport protein TolR
MAVKIGGKGGSMSDINMTPMIDIMLVLLIIFMIVQQGMQKGMEVQVPPTEETEDKAQAIDQIVLDIQPGNTYFLNQEPIPAGQLQQTLTSTFATRVRKVIFVRGAENLAYGEVIYAVDAARGAGVDLVGLVPRDQPQP